MPDSVHADARIRRLEDELRLSDDRFRVVAQATSDVIWDWNLETNVVWWNDNVHSVLGFSEEQVGPDATWWYGNIHPDDRERVISGIHAVINGGGRYWSDEYRYQRGDHTYAFICDRGYVLRDGQKKAQRMIGAGGIAHDFNNVMTAIIGYTDLLLQEFSPKSDPVYEKLMEISKAGHRAVSLTRQLLAYSRKQMLLPCVLDLNRVVTDMEKMLRRVIGEDIDFATGLEPQLGNIKADLGQIEQVILNLVINAMDAMPQGGKLCIETCNVELDDFFVMKENTDISPGAYVMLSIMDTGCGMDEATRLQVFEPFFTTKEPGKGTGLGLSTAFGIIKQSAGHISVNSAPGLGATFRIYLPRVSDSQTVEMGEQLHTPSQRGTETILLAEDDAFLRPFLCKVLRARGYNVIETDNGEQALRRFKELARSPDLLLTDVVMPLLSGRELAERIQELNPKLKILFMSGYTDEAIIRHGIVAGRVDFLQKPFSHQDLVHKVRHMLDQRQSVPN